jgi:hypothetical protein
MYISHDDSKFESSYLGKVLREAGGGGGGGSLKFFFRDGLTWDEVFDWHDLLILPPSRPSKGEKPILFKQK